MRARPAPAPTWRQNTYDGARATAPASSGAPASLDGIGVPLLLAALPVAASVVLGWWLPLALLAGTALAAAAELRRRTEVRAWRRHADHEHRVAEERQAMLARTVATLRVILPAEDVRCVLLGEPVTLPTGQQPKVTVTVR